MSLKKISEQAVNVKSFVAPVDAFDRLISAYNEYKTIAEEERTKRAAISAWEKTRLAEIKAQRDLLIGYLEKSFDERKNNFQQLFETVDKAIANNDNQQLALSLDTIVKLAQSSPFQDLADIDNVRAKLADPNTVWEF
jgi:ribonucleotide reductase alpha subunit